MSDESNLDRLSDLIIKLNSLIRRCEIIDKSGLIVATASRKKLQPLITDEAHYKHMLQAAIRHLTTQSWARAFGEKFYTVNRYEKIIVANITFTNNHLLFVSLSGADDFDENNIEENSTKNRDVFCKRLMFVETICFTISD